VLNQAAQTAKRSPEFAPAYSSIAKRRGKKIASIAKRRGKKIATIAKRRGKKIATIAIARKLLTRAWYLLSDLQAAEASTPPRRP
jgi:hypothetical protein